MKEKGRAAQAAEQFTDPSLYRVFSLFEIQDIFRAKGLPLLIKACDLPFQSQLYIFAGEGDSKLFKQGAPDLKGILIPAPVGETRYLQAAVIYQLSGFRHQIAEYPVDPVAFFLLNQITQSRMIFHVDFGEEGTVFRALKLWLGEQKVKVPLRRVKGGYQPAPVRCP